MSEHTIAVPIDAWKALELICDAINNPDSLHDMVYATFWSKVPNWREHGWELRAVAGASEIIVTARRKT